MNNSTLSLKTNEMLPQDSTYPSSKPQQQQQLQQQKEPVHFRNAFQASKKSNSDISRLENHINKLDQIKSRSYSTEYDENSNSSNTSQQLQQQQSTSSPSFGIKLILKRQKGDKYEIKNSTGAPSSPASNCSYDSSSINSNCEQRPRREASRKVKFIFSETESDDSPIKKKPKYSLNHSMSVPDRSKLYNQVKKINNLPRRFSVQEEYKEVLLPFSQDEIVEKNDDLMNNFRDFKIVLNHSIPFPIALVEDKTNIVHTKALLLIHLYQSYSSPCIICVLCKRFFSIGEFSKHFHITEEDLDEEDDESDSEEFNFNIYTNLIERRTQKKLFKLRKKSYKILPYCLNQNNELNENQLKIWKLFSEKFNQFKQKRQAIIQEQQRIQEEKQKNKLKRKVNSNLRPKSKRIDPEAKNWDHISDDDREKNYYVNRKRLECEKIVYLNKNGSSLSDNEDDGFISSSEDDDSNIEIKKRILESKKVEDEPDLSLSESDDDLEQTKISLMSKNNLVKVNTIENKNHLYYEIPPTPIQKHFNYYDNLSKEILFYLNNNSSLVTPQSLLLYNIKNRFVEIKKIMLAQTSHYKALWLSLTLDLEDNKLKKNFRLKSLI